MSRQHAAPVILNGDYTTILSQLSFTATQGGVSEADIQDLVHKHPGSLPIEEVDPSFKSPIAICRELMTPAGVIDNLLVTPSGLPILVECKLWRNPESRREVVGQILDYAKGLSRWTSADLQREVIRRLGRQGNAMLDLVRAVDPTVDEITFNDTLSHNLRRRRFLLLVVGDGIREVSNRSPSTSSATPVSTSPWASSRCPSSRCPAVVCSLRRASWRGLHRSRGLASPYPKVIASSNLPWILFRPSRGALIWRQPPFFLGMLYSAYFLAGSAL